VATGCVISVGGRGTAELTYSCLG